MKKMYLIQLEIFCLLLLCSLPILGQAEVIKVRVILVDAQFRLKPDMDSIILATVPAGTELDAVEKTGEWFKVKLPPDEEGFVVTGYLHSSMVEVIAEQDVEEKAVVQPEKDVTLPEKSISQQPMIYQEKQRRTSGMEVGFKLCGSGNYFYPDDLNESLRTDIDYYRARAEGNPNSTMQGEYNPLHIGYGGAIEAYINFIPQFGMGVGVGYVHASTQMTYNYSSIFTSWEKALSPEISALPITFSLYFGIPLGNAVKIYACGGIGYYVVNFDWSSIWNFYQLGDTADYLNDFYMKENKIGFHGGLGIELNLNRSFSFVIEAGGRYAKLMDLRGTSKYKVYLNHEISVDEAEDNVILWYGEYERDGKWYPSLSFGEEPSGADVRNIRRGEIALTGYSVQIGFKIKFSTFSARNSRVD